MVMFMHNTEHKKVKMSKCYNICKAAEIHQPIPLPSGLFAHYETATPEDIYNNTLDRK